MYDIFEVFPDDSFVWRACISGRYNKDRKLQELAEASGNRFYAVDIAAGETLQIAPIISPSPPQPTAKAGQGGTRKKADP